METILDWDADLENNLLSQSGIINSVNATSNLIFSPKHPTLIFPSYLLQKNMELHNAVFQMLLPFY
jgi:hypothetical protein